MSTPSGTAKGQVALRKGSLKQPRVAGGETITLEQSPDGGIGPRAPRPSGQISYVFDLLKKKGGTSLSIERINQIATEGGAGKR